MSGKYATTRSTHRKYVDGVVREIRNTARAVAEGRVGDTPKALDTVYFGGGTPSLVSPSFLAEVMRLASLRAQR